MSAEKYWLIGYEKDFDFIIIGEDTGPYCEFPETNEGSGIAKGRPQYIKNLVSHYEGKINVSFDSGRMISKCPAMDDWNKNIREPNRVFDSPDEIMEYIYEEARPLIKTAVYRKHYRENNSLERFSIEGLKPN